MTHLELASKLNEISTMLEEGKELISNEKIIDFQTSAKEIDSKLSEIMEYGRLLRIGIVGEVKSGKSSFLNALLFDGKNVLPSAPTPMTAALTRIKYSDTPQAEIYYYSQTDWKIVTENAKKYDETIQKKYDDYCREFDEKEKERAKANKKSNIVENDTVKRHSQVKMSFCEFEKTKKESVSLEYISCKELVEMVEKNGLDVENHLGKTKIIESDTSDNGSFLKDLDKYVGASGEFTPIVKYTTLQVNDHILEGIEVIDTPGLNDPIRSRSRTTQEFLLECDVVFLIGYCGQFLSEDDMRLIISSLPNEGIKKAVLIGSKLDSAIRQYPSHGNPSFKEAYLGTIKNCEAQAEDNINESTINSRNEKLISQIKNSLPPICVSSLAYSAARHMENNESLSKLEGWIVDNLKSNFPDFEADSKTLMGLSNIPDVKDKVFEETKKQKETIIQERISSLVGSQKGKFLDILDVIADQVRNNQDDLQKCDLEQLQNKINNLKECLDSTRITVRSLFANAGIDSRRTIEDVVVDIGLEMSNHLDIEVIASTKTEHHSNTEGILWWKYTDHWDEIIHTNTADISAVYDNIHSYFFNCMQIINDIYIKLLKIDQLKDKIKESVLAAFEQSDKDFDENRIIIPLENSLKRITLPQFEMDIKVYIDRLDELTAGLSESGAVKNDNISELKRSQDKVMIDISKDIINELRKQAEEIDNCLQKESSDFIDNIVKQLEENKSKIENQIQNKQANLKKYERFSAKLKECKITIQE